MRVELELFVILCLVVFSGGVIAQVNDSNSTNHNGSVIDPVYIGECEVRTSASMSCLPELVSEYYNSGEDNFGICVKEDGSSNCESPVGNENNDSNNHGNESLVDNSSEEISNGEHEDSEDNNQEREKENESEIEVENESEQSEDVDSDGNGVDDETERETKEFHNEYGADMRMFQLERAIKRRVLWGNEIVRVMKNSDKDVERLKAILAELTILSDEANSKVDLNNGPNVDDFISIKKDAKDLISEFKSNVKNQLTVAEKALLREKFNEIDKTELKELGDKIKKKRCELNSVRVEETLSAMGIKDNDLIEKVKNCEKRPNKILENIKEHMKKLSKEKRKELKEKVEKKEVEREKEVKREINKRVVGELEREAKRIERRAEKLKKEGFKRIKKEKARELRKAIG